MELSLSTTTHHHLHLRRHPSKSISFPKKSSSILSFKPINTSFRTLNLQTPNFHNPNYQNPNFQSPNIHNPKTPLSFLKTTFITGVTVAAVLLSRLSLTPAVAAPIPPPATVNTTTTDSQDDEQTLEQHLSTNPNDVNALKNLMEVKIKIGKVNEAIAILNNLINLEPEDSEWQLLKYHLHSYDGDHVSAKLGFENIIEKDPFRVEAYHGLVMAASANQLNGSGSDSNNSSVELENVEKRIVEAMELCKKQRKKDEMRDFKLLLAQIRVIQSNYNEALKIYQELCKEEPRDFRPYLCQGIIYTMLGKNDEAEKNFGKYRRLVPKGHPYARYFDDNMIATKVFAQKVEKEKEKESERAYAKS